MIAEKKTAEAGAAAAVGSAVDGTGSIVVPTSIDSIDEALACGQGFLEVIGRVEAADRAGFGEVKKGLLKDLGVSGADRERVERVLMAIRDHFDAEVGPVPPYRERTPAWPEAVSLKEVVDEVEALVARVMVLHPDYRTAVAYFCLCTWFVEYLDYAPYMVITSPTKRCGKSTLLELMVRLVRRPYPASGKPSEASLFRTIEKYEPTVLIDEVDTFLKTAPELQGVLNGGVNRRLAFVQRCEKLPCGEIVPRDFKTFGFKVLSGISASGVGAPLVDRAIVVKLERKRAGERRERLRSISDEVCETLKQKMCRLAVEYGPHIQAMKSAGRPAMPEELGDRECDKWEAIVALADLVGEAEGARIRRVATFIGTQKGEDPWKERLLAEARDIVVQAASAEGYAFQDFGGAQTIVRTLVDSGRGVVIRAADLHRALVHDPARAWADFSGGRALSQNAMTRALKSFGIESGKIRCAGNCRGFARADIERFAALYASEVDTDGAV